MSSRPLPRMQNGVESGVSAAARRSYALEQVTEFLSGFTGGQVIDIGGACQSNIDFVTGLGHRLYAEDLLSSLEAAGPQAEAIPADCLAFPRSSVHAALCWDRLQFLSEAQLAILLERLHRILTPGGLLLLMFHPEHGQRAAPLACRVTEAGQLMLKPAGPARAFRPFTTRSIEKLFGNFESLKFYLTRDNLQEVIVRR